MQTIDALKAEVEKLKADIEALKEGVEKFSKAPAAAPAHEDFRDTPKPTEKGISNAARIAAARKK